VGADEVALLMYGRGVDTTALRTRFGYSTAWSTAETLDAFVCERGLGPFAPAGSSRADRRADGSLAGARHG